MDFLAKTALTQHIKIGRKRNGQNGGSLLRKKHKEQRRKQPPTCKMKYNTVSNSRDFQPIARKKTPPDPDLFKQAAPREVIQSQQENKSSHDLLVRFERKCVCWGGKTPPAKGVVKYPVSKTCRGPVA